MIARRLGATAAWLALATAPVLAQSLGGAHAPAPAPTPAAVKVVPASTAPHGTTPTAAPSASTPLKPAPAAHAPTPVKLSEVRGRIAAALAAMPSEAPARGRVRPAGAAAAPAATPRIELHWPEERWHVPWPATAERVTITWPK